MKKNIQQRAIDFLGGQTAPLTSDQQGRRILWRCPVCQRVWLQDGQRMDRALRREQIRQLAQELSADITRLPSCQCRLCVWKAGGGTVDVDEYGQGAGYGLCWQIFRPLVFHMQCALLSERWVDEQRVLGAENRPDVVTRLDHFRAVLHTIQALQMPPRWHLLDQGLCTLLAAQMPPGFGQEGTAQWQWQGCHFQIPCPPCGGKAQVSLMMALPPGETFAFPKVFGLWRTLVEMLLRDEGPGVFPSAHPQEEQG